jgi:hypothetical protein
VFLKLEWPSYLRSQPDVEECFPQTTATFTGLKKLSTKMGVGI